jgi:ABC-type lipoprotein release transport system permease subunit
MAFAARLPLVWERAPPLAVAPVELAHDALQMWLGVPLAIRLLILGGALALAGVLLFGRIPLRYSLRNVVVRWKTTISTALAFTLVVGLVTVMLAFVNGMSRLTEASGRPGNVMVLAEGSTDEVFSNLGFSDIGDIANQAGVLHDTAGRALCSRETYFICNQPRENPKPGGPKRRFIQLRGVDDPQITGAVHRLALYDGGAWFSDAGVQAAPGDAAKSSETATGDEGASALIQAVIGEGLAGELASDRTPQQRAAARNPARLEVGDVFNLRDRRWIVTGVLKSAGSTFDSEVWAKHSLVGRMFGKESFSTLVLRTASDAEAHRMKLFFNNEYKKASLAAQVETEYFARLNETNKQFSYAIGFIAFWVAIGGIAGTMNTMFAAISQRTKDIGVLRIIGFARWQVLISFLLESLVIALIGGALGCALGSLADGWTATSVVSSGQGGGKSVVLKLIVDSDIVGKGMLLTVIMGGLGGFVPSIYAMTVRPLESLR